MTSPAMPSPDAARPPASGAEQIVSILHEAGVDAPPPNDDSGALDDDDPDMDADAGSDDDVPLDGVDMDVIRANAALDQNDTDNGKRLLALCGDRLLNVREIGIHAWDGRIWRLEGGDEEMTRSAQTTARLMKLEALFIDPPPQAKQMIARAEELKRKASDKLTDREREELKAGLEAADTLAKRREGRRKFAISSGNRQRTVAMIAQARPHRTVAPAALDADPMKFNVANGTLVFTKVEVTEPDPECPDPDGERTITRTTASVRLAPHDPGDHISKMAACAYDPAAVARGWLAFLERFQPDAAQRRYLQTACGRAMLGGASTQVLIFLYGDGANGKSAFMETIARVIADYGGRLKPESITGTMEQQGDKATPDFARLQGKRFVAIAELPRGAPLREGLVKTMTGSEPMPVRHLQKGFFDLTPEFIPFMSGNQMPEIGGLDKGIWRRMKFLRWPVTLADGEQKPLPRVVAEFMQEADGILNWLIEGALRFLEEGLRDPPSVTELTQSHREDSDPVGAFARDCLRPDKGGPGVQARAMYRGFARYCEANAIKPWGEKSFSLAMKQKGFVRVDKRIRIWTDLLLDEVPHDDPQPSYGGGYDGR